MTPTNTLLRHYPIFDSGISAIVSAKHDYCLAAIEPVPC